MTFVTDLLVAPVRGTDQRVLRGALVYIAEDGQVYVVPSGFSTDYASIPKFLRSWIDQDSGQIREAAVLHDWLYSQGSLSGVTRMRADALFYEAMRRLGMPMLRARAAWFAVRLFGGQFWV